MNSMIISLIKRIPLIEQIAAGLVIGIITAVFFPSAVPIFSIFGDVFVKALKGVAPVLVFVLVMNAMLQRKKNGNTAMKPIIILYILSTFASSLIGVGMSFLFPTRLLLRSAGQAAPAPSGISEVIYNLIMNIVDNPVHSLETANYISILAWAIIIGMALHTCASETTKKVFQELSEGITRVVTWVIHFAPLGIMGLVTESVGASGLSALLGYARLLVILIASYSMVALIVNPIIVFIKIRRNPYPLIFTALRESGLYAFFTRSSAANIPVNLALCKKLGLNPDTYTISIPLGATVNTAGAAITISVLSLAAAYTLGVMVDFPTAFLLCIISTIGACGASGVAGGSLLLIPVACASFGIGNDISMQVVGVGFIISVLEDACETALNSSSDVVFTAAAEWGSKRTN
ncbi:serine/threonine transporter SstT [Allisonella histaminiformans]|uniref:serine/threonine transporter SstT n=1 Tax=Allisonella histaminiformans TaxID=209880 RepID=UPI00352201CF